MVCRGVPYYRLNTFCANTWNVWSTPSIEKRNNDCNICDPTIWDCRGCLEVIQRCLHYGVKPCIWWLTFVICVHENITCCLSPALFQVDVKASVNFCFPMSSYNTPCSRVSYWFQRRGLPYFHDVSGGKHLGNYWALLLRIKRFTN